MALTLDTELVLSKTKTYRLAGVNISRNSEIINGSPASCFMASVRFEILNDAGIPVDSYVLVYKDADFNSFWTNFNSVTFLYQELLNKLSITADVPADTENEVVNVVSDVIPPTP